MKILNKYVHEEVKLLQNPNILNRTTARGIIIDKEDILLIYTKRYDDYSFPGGGVDENEDLMQGLSRELAEETGAQNVKVISEFGIIEELRPIHYPEYDAMNQTSYYYVCSADKTLGEASPEDYEVNNGSVPIWINIHDALRHNKDVIAKNPKSIGYSIQRETFVLEQIIDTLIHI